MPHICELNSGKLTFLEPCKMHSSMHCDLDRAASLPATGPKLSPAIAQAISQLQDLAARRDFHHEGWPEHAKLWRELLNQSKDRSSRDVAPNVLKGDLAAPIGIKLDGRHWRGFQTWFERYVAPELLRLSMDSGVPALQAVRRSNRKGGFPGQSESVFFLAFLDHEASVGSLPEPQPHAAEPTLEDQAAEGGQFASGSSDRQRDVPQHQSSGFWRKMISRFVRRNVFSESGTIEAALQRRWRFGVSVVLVGTFLLSFCTYLPPDPRQGMFVAYSVILFILGLWDMDRANKGIAR